MKTFDKCLRCLKEFEWTSNEVKINEDIFTKVASACCPECAHFIKNQYPMTRQLELEVATLRRVLDEKLN